MIQVINFISWVCCASGNVSNRLGGFRVSLSLSPSDHENLYGALEIDIRFNAFPMCKLTVGATEKISICTVNHSPASGALAMKVEAVVDGLQNVQNDRRCTNGSWCARAVWRNPPQLSLCFQQINI